jgi:hypothetical protein
MVFSLADRIKPTEKQLDFIAEIEKYVGDTFDGKTRQEASEWIDEHLDGYNQMRRFWEEECIIGSYKNL